MKQNNLAIPKEVTALTSTANSDKDKSNTGGKRNQSLVDEYKAKLAKLTSDLASKTAEIQQKTNKISELQAAIKRDEGVMKKTMDENEKLKRESKRPTA